MSKLVKKKDIVGITIAASRVKAKAIYVTLMYKNCKSIKTVALRPGLGGAIIPRSCDHVQQPGEEPCPLDPWIAAPDKSKYADLQTFKLQENPEDDPTGELPQTTPAARPSPTVITMAGSTPLREFILPSFFVICIFVLLYMGVGVYIIIVCTCICVMCVCILYVYI